MAGVVFCIAMYCAYRLGRQTERDAIVKACQQTGAFRVGKSIYTCFKQEKLPQGEEDAP